MSVGLAAAKLKNRVTGQKMNSVPECLSAPEQTIVRNWIPLSPVLVAVLFANRKRGDE